MRIIDEKTGKRLVGENTKEINKTLKKTDPIQTKAEKDLEIDENSPMDPPGAYEATVEGTDFDKMDVLLKTYMDEHKSAIIKIDQFEKALVQFKENSYRLNGDINNAFSEFFKFFDDGLMDHNEREEKQLFPLLHKKLIESGEKGIGEKPQTAVDMMEDDHIKFIQLGALAFNMLGLAGRLPDERSKIFVYDVAYNNARELVELIRLHIYREDNILFPLAHKLISEKEFIAIRTN